MKFLSKDLIVLTLRWVIIHEKELNWKEKIKGSNNFDLSINNTSKVKITSFNPKIYDINLLLFNNC